MVTIENLGLDTLSPGVWTGETSSEVLAKEEWGELVSELKIQSVDGDNYYPFSEIFSKARSPENPRPAISGDHFWHLDLAREGASVGRLVTAIYYAQAEANTPGTEIIDTAALRDVMAHFNVFDEFNEGHGPEVLARLESHFSEGTYQRETLPAAIDKLDPNEAARFLQTTGYDLNTLADEADRMDAKHGITKYNLFTKNPFDPDGGAGLMIDTERGRDIVDPVTGLSHRGLLNKLRAFLDEKEQMLKSEGIIKVVKPTPGKFLLFSREGTLHRAQPGNQTNREIYITWLSTNPQNLVFAS